LSFFVLNSACSGSCDMLMCISPVQARAKFFSFSSGKRYCSYKFAHEAALGT
jgi:hypothetical protein